MPKKISHKAIPAHRKAKDDHANPAPTYDPSADSHPIYEQIYLLPIIERETGAPVYGLEWREQASDAGGTTSWINPPYSIPFYTLDLKLKPSLAKAVLLGVAGDYFNHPFKSWAEVEESGHEEYLLGELRSRSIWGLLSNRHCDQQFIEQIIDIGTNIAGAAKEKIARLRNTNGDDDAKQHAVDYEKIVVDMLKDMGIKDFGYPDEATAINQFHGLAPKSNMPTLMKWMECNSAIHGGRDWTPPKKFLETALDSRGIRLINKNEFEDVYWTKFSLKGSTLHLDHARAYHAGRYFYANPFPGGENNEDFAARVVLSIVKHGLQAESAGNTNGKGGLQIKKSGRKPNDIKFNRVMDCFKDGHKPTRQEWKKFKYEDAKSLIKSLRGMCKNRGVKSPL